MCSHCNVEIVPQYPRPSTLRKVFYGENQHVGVTAFKYRHSPRGGMINGHLIIIIIIKLYLYTDKSGTAAPFTGVYTHSDKNNTLIIKVVKEKKEKNIVRSKFKKKK